MGMAETRQAPAIYRAIAGVMADVGAVGKNGLNKQQGFKFRSIDDVMNALHPAMVKNKVFIVPEIMEQSRETKTTRNGAELVFTLCKIRFTFFAEDGSFVEAVVIGEGMDSGDKATNKAMAIAYKYACFQVFCIPTEEMADPDEECPQESGPEEPGKETPAADRKEKAPRGGKTRKTAGQQKEKGNTAGQGHTEAPPLEEDENAGMTEVMLAAIRAEMDRTGVRESQILGVKSVQAEKLEDMTIREFKIVMNKLKVTPDRKGGKQ